MSQRPDAPLIAHLARVHGLPTATAWQALPYVLLPGEGFGTYLWEQRERLISPDPSQVFRLPWDDAVFDFQDGRQMYASHMEADSQFSDLIPEGLISGRGRCWIRISTGTAYLKSQHLSSPWLRGPQNLLWHIQENPGDWMAVEAWESQAQMREGPGLPQYPDVVLVPVWRGSQEPYRALYPNPSCREGRAWGGFCALARCQFPRSDYRRLACMASDRIMTFGVVLALLTLAYLQQSDEYLAEVTPVLTPAQQKQNAKSLTKRPELRQDLPHYILIDPARAVEYGQHQERETWPAMGHASPKPHSRRGHWRELRAERFGEHRGQRVWVRPSWIGELEWQSEGQRYRVLPPPTVA